MFQISRLERPIVSIPSQARSKVPMVAGFNIIRFFLAIRFSAGCIATSPREIDTQQQCHGGKKPRFQAPNVPVQCSRPPFPQVERAKVHRFRGFKVKRDPVLQGGRLHVVPGSGGFRFPERSDSVTPCSRPTADTSFTDPEALFFQAGLGNPDRFEIESLAACPAGLASHRPRKAIGESIKFPAQFEVVIFSSIGIMILIALSGLVRRAAMGGSGEYAFINLGRSRGGS